MTIGNEEIRVQLRQIQLDLPNPMRAIHKTQHPQLLAQLHQLLKGQPDPWHANNGIEDGDFHFPALLLHLLNLLPENLNQPLLFHRERVLHTYGFRGRRLSDVLDSLVAPPVDGGRVQDVVALLEDQVPQDRVDAGGGVRDEDAFFDGGVDERGDGGAGGVEEVGVLVADEGVWALLGKGLVLAEDVSDGFGVGAEGAWEGMMSGIFFSDWEAGNDEEIGFEMEIGERWERKRRLQNEYHVIKKEKGVFEWALRSMYEIPQSYQTENVTERKEETERKTPASLKRKTRKNPLPTMIQIPPPLRKQKLLPDLLPKAHHRLRRFL